MAELSKITLPDGNNYDLKVYTDHIAPMMTKTFTGVIGTANNFANATFYFGSILPNNGTDIWKIKYRVTAEANGQASAKGYYEVEYGCVGANFIAFKVFNFQKNTSYRPLYNHVVYRATVAGITSGYGHLLGERFYSSWNATTAANARTLTFEIVECVNCTFTFFDSPVKYANAPGTGSTNYDNYTEINGTTQGITRTGTDNNDVNYQNKYYYTGSNTRVAYAKGGRYTLCFTKPPNYILPITATDNSTSGSSKVYTTDSFDPFGEIFQRESSSAIAANGAVGNGTLYRQKNVDARYSFNGIENSANSIMAIGNPIYVVCVPQSDGLVKLHSNPLSFALPSSDDGLMYILLGYASSIYQFELLMHHPVYMYKNGGVREISNYAQYAGNAATVNNHTVNTDVPSNAVFTDTTYSVATTSSNGLMSSTDKTKLNNISGTYNASTETITLTFS